MSLIDKLFSRKPKTSAIARDRLQIIIAQERNSREGSNTPDYIPTLQRELLEVISKYVKIELEDINISREEQNGVDMLALNITLPESRNNEENEKK